MRIGKGRVKRLDAESASVFLESPRRHQSDGAKSSNVTIVQRSPVIEHELERRISTLFRRQIAAVDEQSASEARLNDYVVSRREVEHDQLRATPGAHNRRVRYSAYKAARRRLAQHVRSGHPCRDDSPLADLRVEVARDRFGLR